ncbi:amidohydrolase [Horticoccus sp. 23ND18S-11]|uniref:amidohydrolase n=1 Tax=Horticoccus sp. 23ND18S-11 TaxID=3391832 RepID=UPI0039C8C713
MKFRCLTLLCLPLGLLAQTGKTDVLKAIDDSKATYESIALKIWDFAEIGFQETRSSALLQEQLKLEGFSVQPGVAEIPTAFVASYGSGGPVIGILAEYDALPGVSQEAVPEKKVRPGSNAGHACGHHLFGAASIQTAVAVKNWLKATGRPGTIRVYGTPAEEGGSGKVYMVRAGLFKDVDVAVHWHPGDRNGVTMMPSLANKSGKFRFHGIAAHAAGAPHRGRSALDGVEAMNHMVNLMREHVPETTRMHYVITRGGEAPNVVPAFAEVYYYVRSPQRDIVLEVWERVEKAATGAALGTGTKVDWELTGGVYELLPNEALGRAMQTNLVAVGGVTYTPEERAFALKISQTAIGKPPAPEVAALVSPFNPNPPREGGGSTDVGDVSWAVPTVGLRAATWAPGTPAHSWQAVACGGTTLGLKGMNVAAKTMAGTILDLFEQPAVIAAAKAELEQRRGADFSYAPMLGNRPPALNYRD